MTQDDQIRRLAEQGWLPQSISEILGMNVEVVRRKLREMEVEPGFSLQEQNGLPYGMTAKSFQIRAALGQILVDLMEKHEQPTVSSLTGLNRGEISRAIKWPYRHDWKLSQVERTLDCGDKALKEIV
jgi:hypothetical protein